MICTPIGSGVERHRHRHHRQADERDRLRVDAEIRPHRQLDAVEHRRSAGRCCGAVQGVAGARIDVDALEQLQHLRRDTSGGISAPSRPAAPGPWRRRSAGRAPPGSKSCGARAQAIEMQRRAFGRGDDDRRRRARARLRESRSRASAPSALATRSTAAQRLGRRAAAEIAAGDRDAQAVDAALEQPAAPARRAGRRRPDRRDRGPAWRRRRARGRGPMRANGPEMIEARDERETCARATAGHRSASGRTCRRATTARGSSRWCRSRARAAPGRRRPRRRSRPTSRRSCASVSCGLREGPSWTFSPVKS